MQTITFYNDFLEKEPVFEITDVVSYRVGNDMLEAAWYDGKKRIIQLCDFDSITVLPMTEDAILNSSYPGFSDWYKEQMKKHQAKAAAEEGGVH